METFPSSRVVLFQWFHTSFCSLSNSSFPLTLVFNQVLREKIRKKHPVVHLVLDLTTFFEDNPTAVTRIKIIHWKTCQNFKFLHVIVTEQ